MGFSPLVYSNVKGFLNPDPSLEDMVYWARKNDFSLEQTVNFTDGTKLQIEQALVANGLGANLAREGMIGPTVKTLEEGTKILGEVATEIGQPISDYVLSAEIPPGVFVVGEHGKELRNDLRTYKMGDGPYYAILRPYHLCYFEIPKTLSRVFAGQGKLLDNSAEPHVIVAAVAKRTLEPGTVIKRGIGSFDVRGEAVGIANHPDNVPIGLLYNARVRNRIEPGQSLKISDVDLPDSLALNAWLEIRSRSLAAANLFSYTEENSQAPALS
jgi:predicted homoserine dehydrogenase-like protein